jgi:predicted Zn-dependent peptidase
MNYTKHKLKNGLRVILAPLESTETATVLFLVGTGSKNEQKENNGISHFLEHMFFKGTEKRPNALAISEELDGVGGLYNAFTGKECTGFYVKLAHLHLPLAIDVMSDILLNSKIPEKEIEKEKGVILEEIKLYQDTPTAYVSELFEQLLYGDTPAGWDIIGTKENVSSFKRVDFLDYLENCYSSSNSILVVSGKINPKKVLSLIEKCFEKYPNRKINKKIPTKETQTQPSSLIYSKETDQTHLCLGVRSYDMFNEKRYALALLDTVLGGGMSSRLFTNIREKLGLCYYIKSDQESYTDTGYLMVQAGINHKNIKKVVKLILKEFSNLKEFIVTKKELDKAREYIKGISLIGLETSNNIASFLGKQELLKGEIKLPNEMFEELDKITPLDIQKVAKEIFVEKNLNLSIVAPKKEVPESINNYLIFNK